MEVDKLFSGYIYPAVVEPIARIGVLREISALTMNMPSEENPGKRVLPNLPL
jgi:hypothetical protein